MSTEPQRILIIGAGQEQVPAYERALAMGLRVVGSDMNPAAPAFALPGVERILASTYHPDETVAAVQAFHLKNPLDGVMTLRSITPSRSAPGMSGRLGAAPVARRAFANGISLPSSSLALLRAGSIDATRWPVITSIICSA